MPNSTLLVEETISTDAGRVTVEVVQSTRRMNFLTVHENELDTISAYNTQSTAFYSLASAAASLCVTLSLSAIFADKMSAVATAICWIGIPLSAIMGVVFAMLADIAKKNKECSITRIKGESQGSTTSG